MPVKAKICGLTTPEAIEAAAEAGAAMVGFVFFPPSPRHLSIDKAAELAAKLPDSIRKVGVFVNPDDKQLAAVLDKVPLDLLQLHGDEDNDRIREIRSHFHRPIIKAVKVSCGDDIAAGLQYSEAADMLLFDARVPPQMDQGLPGGNGIAFDWQLLHQRDIAIPWILSGGLNAENVRQAAETTGAAMVDVSSSLEREPGIKDPALIKEFLQTVAEIGK